MFGSDARASSGSIFSDGNWFLAAVEVASNDIAELISITLHTLVACRTSSTHAACKMHSDG